MDDLAAVLALLAAVCFALAATLWQKAALSLTGVSFRHPRSFLVLLTQWVWLAGLAAQIVGVVLQAAALDRGRVSIIQPLLVTTVIWALPLGYFLTHQTIGRRIRQRPPQDSIRDTEHGGRTADSQGEREDSSGRDPTRAPHHHERVTDVLNQGLHARQ